MKGTQNIATLGRVADIARLQLKQILAGDFQLFVYLCALACGFPFALVPAMMVVVLVMLLRPVVTVRFGYLLSSRIGHFAANTEVYLCERDAGLHGCRSLDIFFCLRLVSNRQLKRMWKRKLPVYGLAIYPYLLLFLFPGGRRHIVPSRPNQQADVYGVLRRFPPHLSFTIEEESHGWAELAHMGVPHDGEFVCFHNRDSAYLSATMRGVDWAYHSYRDSRVQNYMSAAEELCRRGYAAIRMGAVVAEPLPRHHPRTIAYAGTNNRSEFMDVFLGAKCRFFISSGTGIDEIPRIFRRPVAYVNWVPMRALVGYPGSLMIPRKLWSERARCFLGFPEILSTELGNLWDSKLYEARGIKPVENTSEEIKDLVVEMDERIKGTWQSTPVDDELQRRFQALWLPGEVDRECPVRIGTEFLRQNRHLLES
jgi:putative glycosyltransferase (TIGR04372 family)